MKQVVKHIHCPVNGWEIDHDAELKKLMIENADVLKRLKEC